MLKDKRIVVAIIMLAIVSLACSFSSGDSTEDGVLFQDDFSRTGSGWDRVSSDLGETDYGDDYYRIYVNDTQVDYWANPGKNFTDVVVSVEATKVGGPDDNDFGVICRYMDEYNFYFFLGSSDGYYAIGKWANGEQLILGQDQLMPTDAIVQGNSTNTIQASCVGSTLTLAINGETVTSITDSDFTEGDVGLIAGTYDTPGTDIHFDNFKVMQP